MTKLRCESQYWPLVDEQGSPSSSPMARCSKKDPNSAAKRNYTEFHREDAAMDVR
jgi:hypothetical protein